MAPESLRLLCKLLFTTENIILKFPGISFSFDLCGCLYAIFSTGNYQAKTKRGVAVITVIQVYDISKAAIQFYETCCNCSC